MDRRLLTIIIVSMATTLAFTAALQWAESQPNLGPCITTSPGCPPRGYLSMESYEFNSPTSVTLNIRNIGWGTTTLLSYIVKDTTGNTFSSTNWSGPVLSSDDLAAVDTVMDGEAFTFQSGSTYMIEIVTSENNLFTFQITL